MRKNIILIFIMAISSLVFSQTSRDSQNLTKVSKTDKSGYCASCPKSEINSNETYHSSRLPNDFPKYIDTGNEQEDLTKFHEAKQTWIKENPERFKKIQRLDLNESIPTNGNIPTKK